GPCTSTRAASRPGGSSRSSWTTWADRSISRSWPSSIPPPDRRKEATMGLGATVGADLLAVPFPKMVLSLAQAIAKGQTALDVASLNTLKVLANTEFDYIP